MTDYNIGKGVYIWNPARIERGEPRKILARLQLAGIQCAAIKICNGLHLIDSLEPVIETLRKGQIRVIGWGYSYLEVNPTREAQIIASACRRYDIGLYLIDVEHEAEGNYTGGRLFIEALRYALPETALGLNTFWNVGQHPAFPWAAFLEYVDFVAPQIYWRAQRPVEKLMQSKKGYANLARAHGRTVPMPFVAGELYTEHGIKPSVAQVSQFLQAIEADQSMQGVLMWALDDNETTSDLWRAFSAYRWKKAGRMIPPQPEGWAQVKYGMHVRSAPQGKKMRGLMKNDLVPIWAIEADPAAGDGGEDSKWGAISPDRNEWIFLGDPNLVEVSMGEPPAPPTPPALYQAVVTPGRGLNVRSGPDGKKIRVLKAGEVIKVYEFKQGWARIHFYKHEWVNTAFIRNVGESSRDDPS